MVGTPRTMLAAERRATTRRRPTKVVSLILVKRAMCKNRAKQRV